MNWLADNYKSLFHFATSLLSRAYVAEERSTAATLIAHFPCKTFESRGFTDAPRTFDNNSRVSLKIRLVN